MAKKQKLSKRTCKMIKSAIGDEKHDVFKYVKLGGRAVEEAGVTVGKKIGRIASDEAGHEITLRTIYKKHC